jgi:hypothetical protein
LLGSIHDASFPRKVKHLHGNAMPTFMAIVVIVSYRYLAMTFQFVHQFTDAGQSDGQVANKHQQLLN